MKSLILLFLLLALMQPKAIFCQSTTGNENWDARFSAPGFGNYGGKILLTPSGDIYLSGGYNSFVDSLPAINFPKWNGSGWSSTVHGVITYATLLAVDSTGLYASGTFLRQSGDTIKGFAKWNGSDWISLDIPPLIVHYTDTTYGKANIFGCQISNGRPVFVGDFDSSNGQVLGGVARWDGDHWFTFKGGIKKTNQYPYRPQIKTSLFDSGNIYVAGGFMKVGDSLVNSIAKWSDADSDWHPIGNSIPLNANILTLVKHGSILYVGGSFTSIAGKGISAIAWWDGSDWHPVGNPKDVVIGSISSIVLDGDLIHIIGSLQKAGKLDVRSIATWNGIAWSDKLDRKDTIWYYQYGYLHSVVPDVTDFFILHNKYYCLTYTHPVSVYYTSPWIFQELHEWQDSVWVPIEKRNYLGLDGSVQSILAENDTNIFVAGQFRTLDGQNIENIARWNGTGWNRITTETIVGSIYSMVKSGDSLFVGGNFYIVGENIKHVALLLHGKFQQLGRWIDSSVSSIYKLHGTLYAAYTPYAYNYFWGVAFLTDSSWMRLSTPSHLLNYARPTVISQDFEGRLIAAGSEFCQMYDSETWWNVGPDTILENSSTIINDIFRTNDNLFFGGRFLTKDFSTNPTLGILSNNGSIKYDNYFTMQYPDIYQLAGRSDNDIYAIGNLYQEINGRNNFIYGVGHYNGQGWESMGSGIDYNSINAIATVGNEVYVGGSFFTAGDKRSSGFAIWHIPPTSNSVNEIVKTNDDISIFTYPNPAQQKTNIEIMSNKSQYVKLNLYDPLGRKLQSIYEGRIDQGVKDFAFSADKLSSGVYVLSLQAENNNYQTKLIVNH